MGLILFFWEPSTEYTSRFPPYLYLLLASYIFSNLPDRISDDPSDVPNFNLSHSVVTGLLLLGPTVVLRALAGPLIPSGLDEFHGLLWLGYFSIMVAGIGWVLHALLDSFSGSGVRLLYPFSGSLVFGTGIDPKGSVNIALAILGLALSSYRFYDTALNLEAGFQLGQSYLYIQALGAVSALLFYWVLLRVIVNRLKGVRINEPRSGDQAKPP